MRADHAWLPSPPRPARAARVTLPSAESGRRASVSQRVRAGRRVSTLWLSCAHRAVLTGHAELSLSERAPDWRGLMDRMRYQ